MTRGDHEKFEPDVGPSQLTGEDQLPAESAAWLLSLDTELSAGSTARPPAPASLSSAAAKALQQTAECLVLLHAAARAGELDDLVAATVDLPAPPPAQDFPFRQVGRFEIIRELGRGGYGLVFLAIDPRLRRPVALKVPRPEALITADLRKRFVREAEMAGTLAHANLITVYETGEDRPLCYIATEYCSGPTLAQWLRGHASPVPAKTAATLLAGLADGVAYAHSRGVLHRDIKPSNVLLAPPETAGDDVRALPLSAYSPKLTDFGLAKMLERNDEATRTGAVLGTPAYMAPEQAMGRTHEISAATDIYALGTILFEMLVGRPPFQGRNDPDTLRQICADEPPALRVLATSVARDLEAIVLKCLEKEPARRYSSAEALAADLRRFLDGRPTMARPAQPLERMAKWAYRRPAVAALVAVSVVAGLLLGTGGWLATISTRAALQLAEASASSAQQSELAMRRVLYASDVSRAMVAWEANDPQQARRLLEKQIPAPGQEDLREFAWRYAWHAMHEEQVLTGHTADVFCVRYSPDGGVLASASKDGDIRLWDARQGSELATLKGHTSEVTDLAFAPDGSKLVSVGEDGKVLVWDIPGRRLERSVRDGGHELFCVALSPDGKLLAAAGIGRQLHLWQTADWRELDQIDGPWETVYDVVFSPASDALLTASQDGPIRMWDVPSGEQVAELVGHPSAVRALAFLPSGTTLVSAGREDATVRLWKIPAAKTGTLAQVDPEKVFPPHHVWLCAVAPCADGKDVIVAAADGAVQRIDLQTKEVVQSLNGHEGHAWSVAVSPSGLYAATSGEDKTVRIWPLAAGRAHARYQLEGPDAFVYCAGRTPQIIQAYKYQARVTDLAGKDLSQPILSVQTRSGDFDGDGRTDQCEFANGRWTMRLAGAGTNSVRTLQLGTGNDTAVVADWNGDGRHDIGTYNAGWFHFDLDGQGQPAETSIPAGGTLELPLIGDWDGNGSADVGCYGDGLVQLFCDRNSPEPTFRFTLPQQSERVFAADWNGDGADEIGYFTSAGLNIDLALSGGPPEYRQSAPTAPIVQVDEGLLDLEQQRAVRPLADSQAMIDAEALRPLVEKLWDNTANYAQLPVLTAVAQRAGLLAVVFPHQGTVQLKNLLRDQPLAAWNLPSCTATEVAISDNGEWLAIASQSGGLDVFSTQTRRHTASLKPVGDTCQTLAFSSDGKNLAFSTAPSGRIGIWQHETSTAVDWFEQSMREDCRVIVFSPGGRLLAASSGRHVKLWDTATGRLSHSLAGHSQLVTAIAFTEDSRTIASATQDGVVKLWDLSTYEQLLTLRNQKSVIARLQFCDAGRQLISVGRAGGTQPAEVHIWRTSAD